jgi:trimeric autotransporter adhesin
MNIGGIMNLPSRSMSRIVRIGAYLGAILLLSFSPACEAQQVVPSPWLTSISPSNVAPGAAGFTLTVNGNAFLPGAVVMWNSAPITTSFVSSTVLNAAVTPALVATAGVVSIYVQNPPPSNGTSAVLSFSVGANPVPVLSGVYPSTLPFGSGDSTLSLSGSGFTGQSVVTWNGSNLPTTFYDNTFISAVIPGKLLEAPGTAQLSVFTPGPGGGAAPTELFPVTIPVQANDLAFDSTSGKIIVSVPGSAGSTGNSLQFVDPVSGHVASPIFIGSEPSRVVLSDDGHYAYTGLSGSPSVSRLDLYSLVSDLNFFLGTALSFGINEGPNYARDLAVVPGQPHSVAVSFKSLEINPNATGLGVFDDGVARANQVAVNGGSLAFASPSSLFGYDNSWYVFSQYEVNASGVSLAGTASGQSFSPATSAIVYQNGQLYGSDGSVVNPATLSFIAAYQPPPSAQFQDVAPDSNAGVTYLLSVDSNLNVVLNAYNQVTTQAIANIPITGITFPSLVNYSQPQVGRLIRWGSDGLAFNDFGGQLYVIHTSSVLPATSPTPTANAIAPASAGVGSPAITVEIQGSGFLASSEVEWNGSPVATTFVSSSELQATISPAELLFAQTASVTVFNPGPPSAVSSPIFFTVGENSAPHLSSISPSAVPANGSTFTLSVTGRGFVPGATIAVDGYPAPTFFDSNSSLHAVVYGVTTTGLNSVTVVNPLPGGGASNEQFLEAYSSNVAPVLFSITPESAALGSPDSIVSLNGYNFTPQSTVYWDKLSLATTFVSAFQLSVDIPASLLANIGAGNITVSNPAPGGGASTSILFPVYLPLTYANDMVYEPYTRMLYLAMSANYSGGQSLLTVDPSTGAQGTPIPLPGDPSALALSDDGQYVYIGFNPQPLIARFNIATQTIDQQFAPAGQGQFVFSLAVMPGQPNTIAAASNTIAVYDSGVARPDTFSTAQGSIAFDSASELIVNSLGTTANIFRLSVDSNGLSTEATGPGLTPGLYDFGPILAFGKAFTTSAQVVDPNSLNIIGSLVPPSPDIIVSTSADQGLQRIFGASYGSYGFVNATAYAFDPNHYQSLASIQVPGPYGTLSVLPPLVRWGQDGISFQSAPGSPFGQPRLYSLRSPSFVLPPYKSENPIPAVTSLSPATVPVGSPNLQLIIEGLDFVPGAVAKVNNNDRETLFVSDSRIVVYMPASDFVKAGSLSIVVCNPDARADSNLVQLSVH